MAQAMKVWVVTHTNMSDEKYYYKVRAASRQAAKDYIVEKYGLYPFTLTASNGENARIYTLMSGYQYVDWGKNQ